MIRVAISGGFDPIHPGHTRYIDEALALGDLLIVILTRDDQLVTKKGYYALSYDERKEVLEWGLSKQSKSYQIVPNLDKDITSNSSLDEYRPNIFAKGGNDWEECNLPEREVCRKLGIKLIFGVGGLKKINSSREIIGRGRNV